MPRDASSQEIRESLSRARNDLLAGRGPGASDAEVAAHTRNRASVGGMSATRRLELTERDTVRARRDPRGIADVSQLVRAELADVAAQLADRLHPRRLGSRTTAALRAAAKANPLGCALAGAAVVVLVRARRRDRRDGDQGLQGQVQRDRLRRRRGHVRSGDVC